jgi:hypothetical protein
MSESTSAASSVVNDAAERIAAIQSLFSPASMHVSCWSLPKEETTAFSSHRQRFRFGSPASPMKRRLQIGGVMTGRGGRTGCRPAE